MAVVPSPHLTSLSSTILDISYTSSDTPPPENLSTNMSKSVALLPLPAGWILRKSITSSCTSTLFTCKVGPSIHLFPVGDQDTGMTQCPPGTSSLKPPHMPCLPGTSSFESRLSGATQYVHFAPGTCPFFLRSLPGAPAICIGVLSPATGVFSMTSFEYRAKFPQHC